MKPRRQDFVRFLSPGSFFDETTEKPVESWDIKTACKMAKEITERHGARPYGFEFLTKLVAGTIDDGEGGELEVKAKTIKTSGTYYIHGVLVPFEKADGDIMRSNMRINGWPIACETTNGYRHMGIFNPDDFVVSLSGSVLERGDDPRHVKYRAEKMKAWQR